ncbi:MAG TPA: FAD-dependent oxidoreductase [Alphaproteobacteria bacterium]|nr:FAD-dependent oxidoreductase [Alphaproteobacteria bacterium]
MNQPPLPHGLCFEDLYDEVGLARLDQIFQSRLEAHAPDLATQLAAGRATPEALGRKAESDLLMALAPYLEDFIAELFSIRAPLAELAARHEELAPLYACKRLFVQRQAVKVHKAEDVEGLDPTPLEAELKRRIGAPLTDLAFARAVLAWMDAEAAHKDDLALALSYAAWATLTEAGNRRWHSSRLFRTPHRLDPLHLIDLGTTEHHGVAMLELPQDRRRHRDGFALTDPGADLPHALDQIHYCIFCHHQQKDSCARGFREKDGGFRKTVFGITLAGCPLDEKISEMHELKAAGRVIGALAMVAVDNPLCAATGHRICNDCMKACIYQKQEPVDIPQAETRVLKDVLNLPWGFEIYGLLTRWNPLNLRQPLPASASGRRVLIAGLGPAGFTLAHHLLNDGHTVFAVDGLKIEPLSSELSGVDAEGRRAPFRPVRDIAELIEPLDDRVMAGFGGVAEYGITVRWDKNFLKIIRLLLERRTRFAMAGGVRLGGTLTLPQCFEELGFDHVALCMGAGRPTVIDMANVLAPGVRMASDFLMALQLTGAAKIDSVANLQLRMPVVVIGGGLTAIDTATEALAYYPVQVEKFLARYEILAAERGEKAVRAFWGPAEIEIADEFLAHARAIRAERVLAASERRLPRLQRLMEEWGGVTIAYRRRLIDAPSYTLNHEEVAKAMEEGIRFAEGLTPLAVEVDAAGHAAGLRLKRERRGPDGVALVDEVRLPARAVLVAAGTRPNTVLAREEPAELAIENTFFRALDEEGKPVTPERVSKPNKPHMLAALRPDGRAISYFGDLHPSFSGNVVKAMGGAKQGWPVVARALARLPAPERTVSEAAFLAQLSHRLRARVREVNRLTPTIIEVVVEAPQAAANFQPGLFYRLQNFETLAAVANGTRLTMEGLALTGATVDKERGLVSLIVLEMGGSSDLCALLKPGEPVVLMGPTGTPTEIASGETVLLAGGGLGNAVLLSIGRAFRAAGSRVLYFAGYRHVEDRYKVEEIEAAADMVVWASDEPPGFTPGRPQDLTFVGTIVEAMVAYQEGRLGAKPIDLMQVDRIMAIGSDGMMAAVARARHTVLAPYLKPQHRAIGSINSPMQCMMKEICAQCLQTQVDPETGARRVVFSCFNQDQPLDWVDFPVLGARLSQNSVQEKLTAEWIDRCLVTMQVRQAAAE